MNPELLQLWKTAGKLLRCRFGFAPVEQVALSIDGPGLTTWGHSPPIFQAVCKNVKFKL